MFELYYKCVRTLFNSLQLCTTIVQLYYHSVTTLLQLCTTLLQLYNALVYIYI